MANALIGYSGFVGSTLLKQTSFDSLYRSTNISEIRGREFEIVVCAGAPAQKWLANQDPEGDRAKIDGLIENLRSVRCSRFILISTVDVFKSPIAVDEDVRIDETDLHPYGLHRLKLERFVETNFSQNVIVRLPGLVGPGLRKNVIYDFLNHNNLHSIDSRGVFQFYPMVNLWFDIETALAQRLQLVHLTAEPVRVSDVSLNGFGRKFDQSLNGNPVTYDLRTKYAEIFGGKGQYQYTRRESLQAIRFYAQSEPRKVQS